MKTNIVDYVAMAGVSVSFVVFKIEDGLKVTVFLGAEEGSPKEIGSRHIPAGLVGERSALDLVNKIVSQHLADEYAKQHDQQASKEDPAL